MIIINVIYSDTDADNTRICEITVGKQSQWYLSVVYRSHVSLLLRSAVNFRKLVVPFQFYNLKSDIYAIICGVKLFKN